MANKAARYCRNFCNAIIGYHLAPSADSATNGEDQLLSLIGDRVQVAIDVGANIGSWTKQLISVRQSVVVHCIEPSHSAAAELAKEFSPFENVTIHRVAMSDECGTVPFFDPGRASEHASLVPSNIGDAPSYDVAVETLDAFVNNLNIGEIDLIKIDAEGEDHKVIFGAAELLKAQRVKFLQFEYNYSWSQSGGTLTKVIRMLVANQYTVFAVTPRGLEPFRVEDTGEFFRYSNFFGFTCWIIKSFR